MHWRFSRPQDTDAVRPQVSDGPRLVASPAKGVRHRAGSRLAWEADGQSLHFANGPDIQNNEGVFLRVPDHPALSGHDKEGQGFSSLTVSARVRLDSLGHHQCLVRQTQFATEVGYLLSVSASGRVRFAVGTWSGKASVDSGNALLETGRWYDVAGLWHNGDLSVTIDGKPSESRAHLGGTLGNIEAPLGIGALDRGHGSTGQFLDGALQSVTIQGTANPASAGGKDMQPDADVTAWGAPVRRMWSCPPVQWNAPARGIPILKGVCHAPIYEPEYEEGAYNHHPEIIFHDGRFHIMWSNNMVGEDRAGQRILVCSAYVFTPPPCLRENGPWTVRRSGGIWGRKRQIVR
jgi:hypothetical protein